MSNKLFPTTVTNNGNANKQTKDADDATSNIVKTSTPTANWQGENIEVYLTIQKGLYDLGYERAISSGAIEPQANDVKTLTEDARAMAEDTYRLEFDPAQQLHDQLKQNEFERDQHELEESRLAEKHATSEVRLREDDAARANARVSPKPVFPVFLAVAAIIFLTIPIAPTLHDYMFLSLDWILAWTLSLLCALAWAAFVAYSILDSKHTAQQSYKQWLGLIAAIGMSVALFLIRLKGAVDFQDILLAFGFSLLESMGALLLSYVADKYRTALHEHETQQMHAKEANELLGAAQNHLARCKERVAELTQKVQNHLRYVAERHLRATQKDKLIDAAVKAVLDGYHAGLATNRGKVLGLKQ